MSTTTTNLGLVKPKLTDAADITAMNPNWDKIDAELIKTPTLASGTSIPSNSDLNNYMTVGNYCCESNSTAATLTNCPTKLAFRMATFYANGSPAYVGQEITEFSSGVTYFRYKDVPNSTWHEWETRYSTARKPSPTEIGAAPTEHNHDGTYYKATGVERGANMVLAAPDSVNGDATFRKLTLNDLPSGIAADTVDGHHVQTTPGNAGLKPIYATQSDLTAGTSALATGTICFVYE